MTAAFLLIALLAIVSATLAFTRRNLIHSALLLVVTWASVAGFYLWAGAEFVAFAQIMVYVGAVSMVVLFAMLLTRPTLADPPAAPDSLVRALGAILTGLLVLWVLGTAVINTPWGNAPAAAPSLTVHDIGQQLMGEYAAALLVIGVLLTVALIGAIIIAATDRDDARGRTVGPDLGPASNPATGTHQGAALQNKEAAP